MLILKTINYMLQNVRAKFVFWVRVNPSPSPLAPIFIINVPKRLSRIPYILPHIMYFRCQVVESNQVYLSGFWIYIKMNMAALFLVNRSWLGVQKTVQEKINPEGILCPKPFHIVWGHRMYPNAKWCSSRSGHGAIHGLKCIISFWQSLWPYWYNFFPQIQCMLNTCTFPNIVVQHNWAHCMETGRHFEVGMLEF